MNRSSLGPTLAGLLFLAATSTSAVAQPYPVLKPGPVPDVPDGGYHGGGDNVPPYNPHPEFVRTPGIGDGYIVNGRIHFKFGGCPYCMRYDIVWTRPGRQESDIRWTKPTVEPAAHTVEAAVAADRQNNIPEDYTINERPVWNTDYVLHVQSVGRYKLKGADGKYYYPVSFVVSKTFHTPDNPDLSDHTRETSDVGVFKKATGVRKGTVDDRPRPFPR